MRALNAQVELSCTPRVLFCAWGWGNSPGFENVRLWEVWDSGTKYKNSGNEAKKYLKTKDITFFSGANDARFAHKFAQFGR